MSDSDFQTTPALDDFLDFLSYDFRATARDAELGVRVAEAFNAIELPPKLEERLHRAVQEELGKRPREDAPSGTLPLNGLLCSVCRKPQRTTPGGDSCENGHGGAPGVEPDDATVEVAVEKVKRERVPKPLPEDWAPDGHAVQLLAGQGFDAAAREDILRDYRRAMTSETSARWDSKRFLKWWKVEKVRRSEDPGLCVHANECPHVCPCPPYCYCKTRTCVRVA